jgi:hypothetical protein
MMASGREGAEQRKQVSGSVALWDLRRCYQSRFRFRAKQVSKTKNGHLRVPRNYGEGEGFDESEINCPLSSVRIDASDASG